MPWCQIQEIQNPLAPGTTLQIFHKRAGIGQLPNTRARRRSKTEFLWQEVLIYYRCHKSVWLYHSSRLWHQLRLHRYLSTPDLYRYPWRKWGKRPFGMLCTSRPRFFLDVGNTASVIFPMTYDGLSGARRRCARPSRTAC